MNFESLVTVFLKIVNSAACVGLYYGLLSSLSSITPYFFIGPYFRLSSIFPYFYIGPYWFFGLGFGPKEPENRRAVRTGLLLGLLGKVLCVVNAPRHQIWYIPHTVLAFYLPCLLIGFTYWVFQADLNLTESSPFSFFINTFIFHLCSPLFLP